MAVIKRDRKNDIYLKWRQLTAAQKKQVIAWWDGVEPTAKEKRQEDFIFNNGECVGQTARGAFSGVFTLPAKKAKPAKAERCQWFAGCTRKATTSRPHPVLKSVQCCEQCAQFVDSARKPTTNKGA